MSRNIKITLAILGVAVVIGLLSLRGLHERVNRLAQDEATEEEARRAVVSAPITTPTDAPSNATIFWAAPAAPGQLAASQIQLQLSSDAAMRGKQVIQALIRIPPLPISAPFRRTSAFWLSMCCPTALQSPIFPTR